MQAVVLAAGRSTRTYPLTVRRPKPLLEVLDASILERNLVAMSGLIEEAVVVVSYRKEMIEEAFGRRFAGIRLVYVDQGQPLGTGHALQAARSHLGERFLVINGDDLFAASDLAELARHECAVLVAEVPDVTRFGAVAAIGGRVTGLIEKPPEGGPGTVSTGAYVLPADALDVPTEPSPRGEIELVGVASALAASGRLECVRARGPWRPIGYPWDYLEANVEALRAIERPTVDETATIAGSVEIVGPVTIGAASVIRSGTVIEGPAWIGSRCVVGPNAYIRPDTVLMDGVRLRGEVVDTVVMRDATAKHECYLGHSVIGERCNIAAGTITADYRHDGRTNWSDVGGVRVDSGRRKLGAFLGDDVRLGIGTLLYPGRKIWPGCVTLPGQVVTADIVG